MTVQQLINELNKVEDKTKPVYMSDEEYPVEFVYEDTFGAVGLFEHDA